MSLPKRKDVLAALGSAIAALDSNPIREAVKPASGSYALFNHLVHAQERVRDVRLIFDRMAAGREELSHVNAQVAALRPKDWPPNTPYPDDVSAAMGVASQLTGALKVDFESLFHFGAVLLDQWAHCVGYLAGVVAPEEHVFHRFVLSLDQPVLAPAFAPLQGEPRSKARWLHFWMRTYRNTFVVHADRPWQRGTNARLIGDEFKIFTPSPPGWEDDVALDAEIVAQLHLAPRWLQEKPVDCWERARPGRLLERIVENVGALDRQRDRDVVANLARRKGITTPSFQTVAGTLAEFVGNSTRLVFQSALQTPPAINLGRSKAGPALEDP